MSFLGENTSFETTEQSVGDVVARLHGILDHSSVFIGLVAASKVVVTSYLLSVPADIVPLIGFLVAFSVYTGNKLTDQDEDQVNYSDRSVFITQRRDTLAALAFTAYAAALAASLTGGIHTSFVALVPGICGLLYSVHWMPGTHINRGKEILFVNTGLVAFGWAVAVTYLPLMFAGTLPLAASLIVFSFVFLRSTINAEAFNVRDIEGDRRAGIATIPTVYGVRTTQHVLYALDVFSLCLLAGGELAGMIPAGSTLILGPVFAYSLVGTYLLGTDVDRRYLCTCIDGEAILMAIAVWVWVTV